MKTLFDNIDENEIKKILKVLDSKIIIFSKGDNIIIDEDNYNIGIILNGYANIEKYDYYGNRSILEKLQLHGIFGKYFYQNEKDISIIATSKCEVLFLEYDSIINKVKNKQFLNNFFNLLSQKIMNENIRIEILAKRTIKDKIWAYFLLLATASSKKIFTLPFSYTELADYLFIDRSAMMRELKKMKDTKMIKTRGKLIKLLD